MAYEKERTWAKTFFVDCLGFPEKEFNELVDDVIKEVEQEQNPIQSKEIKSEETRSEVKAKETITEDMKCEPEDNPYSENCDECDERTFDDIEFIEDNTYALDLYAGETPTTETVVLTFADICPDCGRASLGITEDQLIEVLLDRFEGDPKKTDLLLQLLD